MLGGAFDAFVHERHVIGVDGVSVRADFCQGGEIEIKAAIFACNSFFALNKAFNECAEVDVEVC